MPWYVYILRCGDNTLYTGITDDVIQDILPSVQHCLDFRNSKISVASAKEVIFFFPVLLNAFPEISAAIADANDLIPAIQPLFQFNPAQLGLDGPGGAAGPGPGAL